MTTIPTRLALPIALALSIGAGAPFAAQAQQAPPTGVEEIPDARVRAAVEEELILDDALPENSLRVDIEDGVVELTGTVDNLHARDRAEALASTVRGVRAVVDRIVVVPYWTISDAELEDDARMALLFNPATDSWELDVSVEDQEATLTGIVDSHAEKRLAETLLEGLRGLRAVHNEIEVAYTEERTDTEILADIEERLRWDLLVDAELLDVEVDDGAVSLTGHVGSAAERRRAGYDAWVAGVDSVDTEELEVDPWTRHPARRDSPHVDVSDAEVVAAVEAAMLHDPRVSSADITSTADDGVVTLRGEVATAWEKRAAEQDATNTVGVLVVNDRVRVVADDASEEDIERRLRGALVWDPWVERYELDVDVVDGTAYLRGQVDSFYEKSRAEAVAAGISGVRRIRNQVKVASPAGPLIEDPYTAADDLIYFRWHDYEAYPTLASDADIAEKIDGQLWWSPFVDREDVEVKVSHGVATLSGTVQTPFERRKAIEQAFEGGATWVDDQLEIE